MVVFEPAAAASPIAVIIEAALVTRSDPGRACVGRQGPISRMPVIAMSDRVPIAIDPDIAGAGSHRLYEYARGRWRPNPYADGKIRRKCHSSNQQELRQQRSEEHTSELQSQ